MAQSYIFKPEEWRKFHLPFTPYYLARDPEGGLWHIVEKELEQWKHGVSWNHADTESYLYRFL